MIKFIVVRHGQTEWNKTERFRGRADIPLNAAGQDQARRVASYLAKESIDAIYSSPLQRALRTAQPIAESHHLEVISHEGLNDLDVGALEGLTVEEARQSFPEVIDKWLNAPGHCKFPKGESVKAVKSRLQAFLEDLTHHESQTVVLVSHRVVLHVLLCAALGMDLDQMWSLRQDNACIDRFEKHANGYTVTLVNEIAHLA